MSENLIAGLVSGLIVTLLVVLFRSYWNGTIVPWFEDRVYKDVRIEGAWFGLYPTVVGKPQDTISLVRHGHTVSGTIICTSGSDEGKRYRVTGSFRNLLLTLLYESEDVKNIDRGTITVRCIHNGQRMAGKLAVYDDRTDAVTDLDVVWFRSKDDLASVLESTKTQKEMAKQIRKQELEIAKKVKMLSGETEKPRTDAGLSNADGCIEASEQTDGEAILKSSPVTDAASEAPHP